MTTASTKQAGSGSTENVQPCQRSIQPWGNARCFSSTTGPRAVCNATVGEPLSPVLVQPPATSHRTTRLASLLPLHITISYDLGEHLIPGPEISDFVLFAIQLDKAQSFTLPR